MVCLETSEAIRPHLHSDVLASQGRIMKMCHIVI